MGSSFRNSGTEYVGNKTPRQIQNFSFCLGNILAKKKQPKNQQKPLYITPAMASACLGNLPRVTICFFNSWYYLFYLYCIVYLKHTWTVETEDNVSPVDPLFSFFVCPCYRRRTHYPTLEKSGAQNIAACENQGKQRELIDHWKSMFLIKNNSRWRKKRKKELTEIQVLTKRFTKRVLKKTKVTELFKPINYWEILRNLIHG